MVLTSLGKEEISLDSGIKLLQAKHTTCCTLGFLFLRDLEVLLQFQEVHMKMYK